MVAGKKKSEFCRYLIRHLTCNKIFFLFILLCLEILVVWSYLHFQEDVLLKNKLAPALLVSVRNQYKKLSGISKKKHVIKEFTMRGDWLNSRSRELVRDRQPAGDFVHYTDDERLCGRETSALLILVISKFGQIDERETVRNTWGSVEHLGTPPGRKRDLRWRRIFVIANHPPSFLRGKEIESELSTKNDTLRVDLMEHKVFANMKFYGALTWALNSCRFKYILTVDIENFVNIPVLYETIHSHRFIGQTDVYAGDRQVTEILAPDSNEKYSKTNLTFAAGGAILMSRDLVKKAVPLLRLHKGMKYEGYKLMVGNVVSLLNITCYHVPSFVASAQRCRFEKEFVVTKVANTESIQKCFRQFFKKLSEYM